jgi:glycosyltransferase involved in cell wall biosynthesis
MTPLLLGSRRMSATQVDIVVGGLWHAPGLASGLTSAGCSVRLITSVASFRTRDVDVRVVPGARYPLRLVSGFRRSDVAVHVGFGLAARGFLRPNSVVIAWSSFALGSLLAQERPVVVTRGSTHAFRQRETLLKTERESGCPLPVPSRAMVRLERLEYSRATRVTVPTSDIAQDPLWVDDGANLNVAPYGFPGWAAEVKRGGRVPGRLVFAGEIGYRKGVDYMAAALPIPVHGATECILFGDLARGFSIDRLRSWWVTAGSVSQARLRAELSKASALVLLSREEGMARVGQEALACGTPIVVSPQSGLGTWLSRGGGFVVDPADGDAVRAALARIEDEWEYHSATAAETAQSWSWEDHARAVIAGLREC